MSTPQNAFSDIISDAIQGKKPSKWAIQLTLLLGISVVFKNIYFIVYSPLLFRIRELFFPNFNDEYLSLILQFITLYCFLSLSVLYKKWLTSFINKMSSIYLEYNDIEEIIGIYEDVMNDNKNIFDLMNINENSFNFIMLGLSNTLYIVLLYMFLDSFIYLYIGSHLFLEIGYVSGLIIIILSVLLYIYFEIKPLEEILVTQESDSNNPLSLFFQKLYTNVAEKKGDKYETIASILTLFLIIPKVDYNKQGSWIGIYLCSPELKELIKDMRDKESSVIYFPYNRFDDFFDCNKISILEDLTNTQNILPMDFFKRLQGKVGKDHPIEMKGLTVKLNQSFNDNITLPYLSITLIPWKGQKITNKLVPNSSGRDSSGNTGYKLEKTPQNQRLFTVLLMGDNDSVKNYKYQLSLRALEAKPDNIYFTFKSE